MQEAGFQVVDEGLRCLWNPDTEAMKACEEFGRKVAGLF